MAAGGEDTAGEKDLIVGGREQPEMVLLHNNGNGTFTAQPALTIEQASGGFGNLVTLDIDGDGELDVVGVLPDANLLVVVRGHPLQGLGEISRHAVPGAPRLVRSADVNGDGISDLVMITDTGLVLLKGNERQDFDPPEASIPGDDMIDFAAVDLDGDRDADLMIARDGGVEVRLGDGAGGFPDRRRFIPGTFDQLAVADLTGDGSPDLAVADSQATGVTVFVNNGEGNLSQEGIPATDLAASDLIPIDVNGDNVNELLVLERTTGMVTVLFADSNGQLNEDASLLVGPNVAAELTVAKLVGNDDLPDFVLAEPAAGQIVIVENKTDLAPPIITPTPTRTRTAAPMPTDTPSVTLMPTDIPVPTSTPAPTEEPPTPDTRPTDTPAVPSCAGDCNGDGLVTIEEIVAGVGILLDNARMDTCPASNVDRDDLVSIDELLLGIQNGLDGCE